MQLLSIDVGIKNLAYCLFNVDTTMQIEDWGIFNLTGNIEHNCHCNKKAYFYKEKYLLPFFFSHSTFQQLPPQHTFLFLQDLMWVLIQILKSHCNTI